MDTSTINQGVNGTLWDNPMKMEVYSLENCLSKYLKIIYKWIMFDCYSLVLTNSLLWNMTHL